MAEEPKHNNLAFADEGLRVLIVDDCIDFADIFGLFLISLGYEVKVRYNETSAINEAQQYAPHLVFLGIDRPNPRFEIVQRMQATPELAHSIFIASSVYDDRESKREALAAGFHKYLTKPCDFPALKIWVDTCQEALSHRVAFAI